MWGLHSESIAPLFHTLVIERSMRRGKWWIFFIWERRERLRWPIYFWWRGGIHYAVTLEYDSEYEGYDLIFLSCQRKHMLPGKIQRTHVRRQKYLFNSPHTLQPHPVSKEQATKKLKQISAMGAFQSSSLNAVESRLFIKRSPEIPGISIKKSPGIPIQLLATLSLKAAVQKLLCYTVPIK